MLWKDQLTPEILKDLYEFDTELEDGSLQQTCSAYRVISKNGKTSLDLLRGGKYRVRYTVVTLWKDASRAQGVRESKFEPIYEKDMMYTFPESDDEKKPCA